MKYRYQAGEGGDSAVYEVLLDRHGDGYRVSVSGESGDPVVFDLEVLDAQPGSLTLYFAPARHPERSGAPQEAAESKDVVRPQVVYWAAEGEARWLSSGGCTYRLERPKERAGRRAAAGRSAGEDTLRAPMPAQVRAVQVAEGDKVEAGQTLLLLEAMKMEIKLASPRAARVARLYAREGTTVERDQVLVELE